MRFLKQMAIGLVLVSSLVATMAGCPSQRQTSRDQRLTGSPSRFALYGWGLATGCTKVNVRNRQIEVIEGGTKSVRTRISTDEMDRLQTLLDGLELEHFHPRAEWFEPEADGRPLSMSQRLAAADWSYSLVFWWDDERVAFHLPPAMLRKRVPETDRRVYAKMDEIADSLRGLGNKCLDSRKARPPDERAIKQLHSEMAEIAAESLPRWR